MRRRLGNIGFAVVTMVLVLFTGFCCTGAAMSRTNLSVQEIEGYYREKEQELVEGVRAFLEERGFSNSGVMLTRVVDTDGSRQYTLTVHHGRINRMDETDRQNLLKELEKIVFDDEDSVFEHKFFVNQ